MQNMSSRKRKTTYRNEWEVMCRKCHATVKAIGADETAEKWNSRKSP